MLGRPLKYQNEEERKEAKINYVRKYIEKNKTCLCTHCDREYHIMSKHKHFKSKKHKLP